jgi:glucoamylase
MLYAQRGALSLAFCCSTPWKKTSVGFVGVSDGWQDISSHYEMLWEYTQAENGNIALTGEIDLQACGGEFVTAIGLGAIWSAAGQEARSTLLGNYEGLREQYVRHWHHWHSELDALDAIPTQHDLFRTSMAVMRSHESKDFLGGVIASLSIPWGFNKGDEDLGGYHLIWPRDLVETAGGLLAGEPSVTRFGCCTTYMSLRKKMDIGHKIFGSTVVPIGMGCRWTRRPFQFYCST